MTVQLVNETLNGPTLYTGNSLSQRDWMHVLRCLVTDCSARAVNHPSGHGTRLYGADGYICKYTTLTSGVVYFDAYGNSPVWTYIALLDAVLLGEREMRKEQ